MSFLETRGSSTFTNTKNKLAGVAFIFKGNSYTLTTFQVLTNDLDIINKELEDKLKINANFFLNAPIVVDLKTVEEQNLPIHLPSLKQVLQDNNLIPVGVINASSDMQQQALNCNLAILHSYSKSKLSKSDNTSKSKEESQFIEKIELTNTSSSTLVTENIRSGQQIYARGGDLVVMASVSNGAELLADGHIHVYGTLRGRALAGVSGDTSARIFCQKLEPELVSIAGQYMLSEDIEKFAWGVPAQAYISSENLLIESLTK